MPVPVPLAGRSPEILLGTDLNDEQEMSPRAQTWSVLRWVAPDESSNATVVVLGSSAVPIDAAKTGSFSRPFGQRLVRGPTLRPRWSTSPRHRDPALLTPDDQSPVAARTPSELVEAVP